LRSRKAERSSRLKSSLVSAQLNKALPLTNKWRTKIESYHNTVPGGQMITTGIVVQTLVRETNHEGAKDLKESSSG